MSLKEWGKTKAAMEKLLQLDPKNKRAQDMLTQATKELGQTKKKGRRVQIEEVEEEEAAVSSEAPPTNSSSTSSSTPKAELTPPTKSVAEAAPPAVVTVPMPKDVQQWKEKGNDLFRRGQYAEAVEVYSKAVDKLDRGMWRGMGTIQEFLSMYCIAGEGHEASLSTILNNRAACHLKNGTTQACVADCTRSLQLVPINVKALIRRAKAYEFMDK